MLRQVYGGRIEAMLVFVLTVICFIGVIQATIYARAHAATPDEMKSWYEELNNDEWKHELIEEHRRYINEHQKWSDDLRPRCIELALSLS